MNFKKLLPVAVMSLVLLAGCGGGEDSNHQVTIDNKAELTAAWVAESAPRELAVTVKTKVGEVFEEGNALTESLAGKLTIKSSNASVVSVNGFTLTPLAVGTAKISVKYYGATDYVEITVDAKPVEPPVVEATPSQVMAAVDTNGLKKYHVSGYIVSWGTKTGVNNYGEMYVGDAADSAESASMYVYGSYAVGGENAGFTWTGERYTISYAADFASADLTKNLKIGDQVEMYVIRADYGTTKEVKGQVISATPAAVIPCTSVVLNKETLSLVAGSSETLTIDILPVNCNQVPSWSSSAPTIASVANGAVTAIAAGEATITVTVGAQTDSCVVTVTAAAANLVTLNNVNILGYSGTQVVYPVKGTKPTVEVSDVTFQYAGIACYDAGIIQWAKVGHEKYDIGMICNTTAFGSAISKIEVVYAQGKVQNANANAFDFRFGTAADLSASAMVSFDTVVGTESYIITPNVAGATYFSMTSNIGYAQHVASIVITLS